MTIALIALYDLFIYIVGVTLIAKSIKRGGFRFFISLLAASLLVFTLFIYDFATEKVPIFIDGKYLIKYEITTVFNKITFYK